MDVEKLKQDLDNDKFWLLVRKFSVAPAGEARAHAKQAVLIHVAELLCQMERKS